MIVCICKAVSDRQIRSAVQAGATCMRELSRDLGVGKCCGKCLPEAKRTLSACLSDGDAIAASGFFTKASPEYAV